VLPHHLPGPHAVRGGTCSGRNGADPILRPLVSSLTPWGPYHETKPPKVKSRLFIVCPIAHDRAKARNSSCATLSRTRLLRTATPGFQPGKKVARVGRCCLLLHVSAGQKPSRLLATPARLAWLSRRALPTAIEGKSAAEPPTDQRRSQSSVPRHTKRRASRAGSPTRAT
jgi:hypothetical protein